MTRQASRPTSSRKSPAKPARAGLGCGWWLGRLLVLGLLLAAAGVMAMYFMWGRNLPSVADLDVLEYSGQTRVYDRSGQLIGTLTPSLGSGNSVNRDLLKPNEISHWVQKAVVTSEDRRFYEHHGVDYIGITRGFVKGILKRDLEGGSSITQQVVKNTLLSDLHAARTPERKFKEALLAYQLDRDFSKDKILNAYLNIIYWGDGGRSDIVGIGSAARAYFGKSADKLNLPESVYLATIIPAPNRRYRDFTAYRPLMKSVLSRMVDDGKITQAEADAAWKTPIYPAGWRISWNNDGTVARATLENADRLQQNLDATDPGSANRYQYQGYLQAVEKEMLNHVSRKQLYDGGKIFTGMDIAAQQSAEKASLNADLPDGATLGIALVNPQNGEALALVGQKLSAARPSDWNNATQAQRQVGSSIKPLLYTLALQNGWKQSDTVLDSPIAGDYQPMNYDRRWTGRYVTMRYALDHSLNLPTVRIGQELGIDKFESKLRELGLTPPPDGGLSLSIGTLEASPLQLAAAYAPFANGGVWYEAHLVRNFQDKLGKTLYTYTPVSRRVWDEQTAWLGLDMLRGVVSDLTPRQGGLATKAQIPGWEVGGKTGTTNDIKDLWFAGVTPLISGAVWVGKQESGSLPQWAYSGDIPTPVWQQAVAGALADRGKATFKEPGGISYRVVRRVNMAFRDHEAGAEPVARDGSRSRQAQQAAPAPQPAPTEETPAPSVPLDEQNQAPNINDIPAVPPQNNWGTNNDQSTPDAQPAPSVPVSPEKAAPMPEPVQGLPDNTPTPDPNGDTITPNNSAAPADAGQQSTWATPAQP